MLCISQTGTNTLMVLLFRVRNTSLVLVFASCVPPAKEYVVDPIVKHCNRSKWTGADVSFFNEHNTTVCPHSDAF